MRARSQLRGTVGHPDSSVTVSRSKFRRGSAVGRVAGRRSTLLMTLGVLLGIALTACVEKPRPSEVTPFAFPAVGAGQKDTAQFGARSGPTVP